MVEREDNAKTKFWNTSQTYKWLEKDKTRSKREYKVWKQDE